MGFKISDWILPSSMNSETVFSRRSDELLHSSKSTTRMSSKVSILKLLAPCMFPAMRGPPKKRASSSAILPSAATGWLAGLSTPLVPMAIHWDRLTVVCMATIEKRSKSQSHWFFQISQNWSYFTCETGLVSHFAGWCRTILTHFVSMISLKLVLIFLKIYHSEKHQPISSNFITFRGAPSVFWKSDQLHTGPQVPRD